MMGSYTAQLLYGKTDSFHGGIIPTHSLMLWENSVPRWTLSQITKDTKRDSIVWVPALERMVEDAMLMLGLFVARDETLISYARQVIPAHVSLNELELYRDTTQPVRESLYTVCRRIQFSGYLVASVLEGSHLLLPGQLEPLRKYRINGEICKSISGETLIGKEAEKDIELEVQLAEGPQPDPSRRSFRVLNGIRRERKN